MNNDLPPSWKFEEVVTINCEFNLFGLASFSTENSVLIFVRNSQVKNC